MSPVLKRHPERTVSEHDKAASVLREPATREMFERALPGASEAALNDAAEAFATNFANRTRRMGAL